MTDPFSWYRVLLVTNTGARDWFLPFYKSRSDARLAADTIASRVPSIQRAQVVHTQLADENAGFDEWSTVSEYRNGDKPESIRRLQLGAAQLRCSSRMVINGEEYRTARRLLLRVILNYRKITPWPKQDAE